MNSSINDLRKAIADHADNQIFQAQGIPPLFVADERARIALVGQAPGLQAQKKGRAWDDASGQRLMAWLGVDEATFRDPAVFAILPMDFYYPGKGGHGDKPPRKEFAAQWHPKLLAQMPDIRLTVLVGRYAQDHYLKGVKKRNLTETVRAYEDYLPAYFPIVHPSPLNFRWLGKNPWFETLVIPVLQKTVAGFITGVQQ